MMDWILGIIDQFGPIGILLLMLLENVFPPIPSELIMPFAGFTAARRGSSLWVAVLAGSAGSLAGTGLWYLLARKIEEERFRRFLQRHGRWLAMDTNDLDRAKSWFHDHGTAAVFLCRLVPGLRTLISVPAGFCRMPVFTFLLYSAAGTLLWSFGLAYAGQQLGENHHKISDTLSLISNVVMAGLVFLYLWRVIRWHPASHSTGA